MSENNTGILALDCETVGVEKWGKFTTIRRSNEFNNLARVSIVDQKGDCIYDRYVKPTQEVKEYRTELSGIRPENLENADNFEKVRGEVAEIIRDKIVVGQSIGYDMNYLFLHHRAELLRDTSEIHKTIGKTFSLKELAANELGILFQEGEHDSIEDARVSMKLYNKFQKQLDDIASKKKTYEMQIPKKFIHHIIGTKGKTIKKMKKISGAEINIDTSSTIVNVTAENSDSLTIAKELINKVITNPTKAMLEMKKLPSYKSFMNQLLETWILLGICKEGSDRLEKSEEGNVIFEINISTKTPGLGQILGNTEKMVEDIQTSSGAEIKKKLSYAFKISGPNPASLSKAKVLIHDMISIENPNKLFKKDALKLLEGCKEEPAIMENANDIILNEEVCEVPIPKRLGKPILQIRKTIIPKISGLTNAEIQMKKIYTIEIVGDNSESVFKAKELITKIIFPNAN